MNIVFFGTSNVALPVLESLLKEHKILSVVTSPDAVVGRKQEFSESPVSSLAKDLKLTLLKPEKVKNNTEFMFELQKLNADIFVVVSYGKILPADIINLPKYKTINVHFSVLPKYRGSSPIQYALLNGDTQTGTSIFVLDENMDTGPLLGQEIVNIEPGDNFFTLSDKLAKKSAGIINSVIKDYIDGKIIPLPQDEARATYTKIITKQDGKIDWNKSAQEIYNQFRAFYIWPGVWTIWSGKKIKVLDCMTTEIEASATENYRNGQVAQGGVVACGNNTYLKIKTLQLEGKNETDIGSFLNGYKDFVGTKLD